MEIPRNTSEIALANIAKLRAVLAAQESRVTAEAAERVAFDAWLARVNKTMRGMVNLGVDDIDDWGYWDAWDAGMSAAEAAEEALVAAGWAS